MTVYRKSKICHGLDILMSPHSIFVLVPFLFILEIFHTKI